MLLQISPSAILNIFWGEKLKFEISASTSKFIHIFQDGVEVHMVHVGGVDPFQYLCSKCFWIYLVRIYSVSELYQRVFIALARRTTILDSADQYPSTGTEDILRQCDEAFVTGLKFGYIRPLGFQEESMTTANVVSLV